MLILGSFITMKQRHNRFTKWH